MTGPRECSGAIKNDCKIITWM